MELTNYTFPEDPSKWREGLENHKGTLIAWRIKDNEKHIVVFYFSQTPKLDKSGNPDLEQYNTRTFQFNSRGAAINACWTFIRQE
jgi:hypothetical protein